MVLEREWRTQKVLLECALRLEPAGMSLNAVLEQPIFLFDSAFPTNIDSTAFK
jgi:hypothetical protein